MAESATKSPLALFKLIVTALVNAFAKSAVPLTLPETLPVKFVALISLLKAITFELSKKDTSARLLLLFSFNFAVTF